MKTHSDKKLFVSIGPSEIYSNLALLIFYTPYWRKISRMLNKLRQMNHLDFKGASHLRMERYAKQAYRDTKLPGLVRAFLRDCIENEFKIDVDPRRKYCNL